MLVTIGSVYSVHVKVPPVDLPDRLELMGSWPTVYEKDGAPSDSADYSVIVYARGDHFALHDLMDFMRPYGVTSGRWLTDFYEVI